MFSWERLAPLVRVDDLSVVPDDWFAPMVSCREVRRLDETAAEATFPPPDDWPAIGLLEGTETLKRQVKFVDLNLVLKP